MTNDLLFENYNEVERYDIKIHLSAIKDAAAIKAEFHTEPYVQYAEGLLEIPATLYNEHFEEDIMMIGLEEGSRLYTIKKDGQPLLPSPGSVILSERLAEKLGAKAGDHIEVKCALFQYKDERVRFHVSDIIEQNIGMSAYASRTHISQLMGGNDLTNRMILKAYPEGGSLLKDKYRDSAQIEGINDVKDLIRTLQKVVNTYLSMMKMMAILSVLMGFAIIYNSYSIILSEREKEFASLLVLGMEEKEIISIVNLEQWLICAVAIPLGIPLANILFHIVGKASSNDMFTLHLKVDGLSFLIGLCFTLFSIIIAQLFASYKINHIKISDALKADE